MTLHEVKQPEELFALGGIFYEMHGEAWCDTPLETWVLDTKRGGYVLVCDADGEGE